MKHTIQVHKDWNSLYTERPLKDLPWVSPVIHPELKKVIDELPLNDGTALDIGCGTGQVSRYLALKGYDVTAIDIAEQAIRISKKLNNTGKNIKYTVANSLTFNSEYPFDLVVDFLHIHDIEIPDIYTYIANLKNLVADNGYLIISTFSFEGNDPYITRPSYYVNQKITYYSPKFLLNLLGKEFKFVEKKELIVGNENKWYVGYILIIKNHEKQIFDYQK